MLDRERIKRKLEIIHVCLGRLERLALSGRQEFLADFRSADAAKHNLQVAIEAMLDVANHLIARMGYPVPANHAEAFETIAREGWLDENDLARFAAMTRFRNRLVHLYEDIDDGQVYDILRDDLGDFRIFMKSIADKI